MRFSAQTWHGSFGYVDQPEISEDLTPTDVEFDAAGVDTHERQQGRNRKALFFFMKILASLFVLMVVVYVAFGMQHV